MEIKLYQQEVKRTLPELGSKQLDITHMIFGMFSEFNELYDAIDKVNVSEELSDISWYFFNYCNITNIEVSDLLTFSTSYYFRIEKHYAKKLVSDLSKLTNSEKRELAYKKEFLQEDRINLVTQVAMSLNDCYVSYNVDIFDSLQKNIDKLKSRYPEKFTQHYALNRNLETERKILEGKGNEE